MMKRGLLLGFAGLLALASGIWFFNDQQVEKEYYQPRQVEDTEQGAAAYLAYMNKLRANPATGEVDPHDVLKARQQVAALRAKKGKKSALGLDWELVGPTNVAGRTRALYIDNNDPKIFYMGSVGGGFWKSTNAGATWELKSDPNSNHAVVCIEQAPDGTIYYGTGEGLYATDGGGRNYSPAFIGGGIYKSTDGGETFTVIQSTVPSPNNNNTEFANVGKLEIDPNNSNLIYAATNRGLRVSTDGGTNWSNPITGVAGLLPATDMTMSPSGVVWVKVGNTIQKNDGAGTPFTEVTGVQLPRNGARMRIAVSPEDENYVYVISTNPNGSFDAAYQSTDGGANWRVIGQLNARLNPHRNQGRWNNAVTVDPKNKERIIIGGIDIWEWSEQNGWLQLSLWSLNPSSQLYVHADNHNVVFSKTDPDNTFYVVNDGGISRTTDDGITFSTLVKNYSTITYFYIDVGPGNRAAGGSQDQGTTLIDPSGAIATDAVIYNGNYRILGGDGAGTVFSRLDPGVMAATSQYLAMRRTTDYGQTWNDPTNYNRLDPTTTFYGTGQYANFAAPIELWEKLDDPLSEDSIRYGADTISLSLGFGNGLTSFQGQFSQPNDYEILKEVNGELVPDSAIFTAENVVIRAGNQEVITDANGNFTGDGSGTFNPDDGSFQITFNAPVVVEIFGEAPTRYRAGDIVKVQSATNELPLFDTLTTDLLPNQERFVQDPVQSMLFIGLTTHRVSKVAGKYTRNHFGGIWMTREFLSRPEAVPQWIHIGVLADGEEVTALEATRDGDILYVGTAAGRIYRISNLSVGRDSASADIDSLYISNNFIRPSTSVLEQRSIPINVGNRAITSISAHPNDPGRVIATAGNYGAGTYVFFNANADAQTPPAFTPIQGDLPAMPVYSCTFNYTGNPNQAIIGTEMGIFTTDDITAGNVSWTQEINNFASLPVFDLVQDITVRYDEVDDDSFEGSIYAGTHGLGIWRTTSTANFVNIGTDEFEVEEERELPRVDVYPNPATEVVNVELDLQNRSDVEISILDLNGKVVKRTRFDNVSANTEEVEVRVGNLPRGAYVINVVAGKVSRTGKFIKQ